MKKASSFVLIVIFFILIVFLYLKTSTFNNLNDIYLKTNIANTIEGIEQFPNSYQPYLREISNKHPNWKFIPLNTNLDWNYVISQENIFGKNLVPLNFSDNWKNTTPGQYNVEVDAGWVDCSKQAVEYCMDSRNFLNEVRLFQFETLSYDQYTNNLQAVEKILYGTEFYSQKVSYLDSNGNIINMNETYSSLILKGGQTSKVSPYHLASRIKQEVGPFLSHSSISGTVNGFKGLYNFYNIGATSSAEPMGAIKNGLQYAKDGKGASQEIKNKYLIPWNTKEKAITGGAIFIGSSYINVGQNTIYLQKFDVNDVNGDGLFWHQYMTNVLAPYSESKSIYNGYQKIGMLDTPLTFIIPVYKNMPNIPVDSPNINVNDFENDNTKVYCNATNVNIRTGPSSSYEIITRVSNPDQMTRIKRGKQQGERWDKVVLQNGIVGYIYQQYVTEAPQVPELPEKPEIPEVPEIDIDIEFDSSLKVNGLEISGVRYEENLVKDIKKKIITDLDIQIIDKNGQVMQDNDVVGTGSKIQIKKDGKILKEYKIIIYGDINGDGKITSVDLLVLQRYILEIDKLEEIYIKAGNIRKNGKKPTSIDLLLIQRHILGLEIIEQ